MPIAVPHARHFRRPARTCRWSPYCSPGRPHLSKEKTPAVEGRACSYRQGKGWGVEPDTASLHTNRRVTVIPAGSAGIQGWLSPSTSWGWWLSPFPPAFPAGAGSGAMMRCVEPCVLNGHGELGCRRTRKHFRHDRLPDSVASAYAGPIDSRGEACVTERAGRRESAPSRGFARDVLSENVSPSANGS